MNVNQNNSSPKSADTVTKLADAAKAQAGKSAEQISGVAAMARDGLNQTVDVNEKATERSQQVFLASLETATHHARDASERVTKALGFSGDAGERLAGQAKDNMDAVSRCGTVLTQAFQDASRGWFELAQQHWQRNLEGINRLASSKTVQEFATTQSELIRQGLEHIVGDSQAIAQASLKAMDQARSTFPNSLHKAA